MALKSLLRCIESFKPRHAAMWNLVKTKYSHLKVALHSCGSIYRLLPDFIEAGLDIIQPVQITAREMEPQRLKEEFGKDIVFGEEVVILRLFFPSEPRRGKRRCEKKSLSFRSGGGYVFQQVHNIMAGVPREYYRHVRRS